MGMGQSVEAYCRSLEAAGVDFCRGALLSDHCSFRIGGPVQVLVKPRGEEQLLWALRQAEENGVRFRVIGRGTNVLFSDRGLSGAVIVTGGLNELTCQGRYLTAACGVPLSVMCAAARDRGLSGLEFAFGIPGNCGGALYMNAGAFGGEVAGCLRSCRFYDIKSGKISTMRLEDMKMSYRHSIFMSHPEWVILSGTFALTYGDRREVEALMEEYRIRRQRSQPHDAPNAGSVFKRPSAAPAGKLIEDCGLKGYRIGGAEVSVVHAGFIQNRGGASAADVLALIAYIRSVVQERCGVVLEPEICYLDDDETVL